MTQNDRLLLVLPVSLISPSCFPFRVDIQIIDLKVTKPPPSKSLHTGNRQLDRGHFIYTRALLCSVTETQGPQMSDIMGVKKEHVKNVETSTK